MYEFYKRLCFSIIEAFEDKQVPSYLFSGVLAYLSAIYPANDDLDVLAYVLTDSMLRERCYYRTRLSWLQGCAYYLEVCNYARYCEMFSPHINSC